MTVECILKSVKFQSDGWNVLEMEPIEEEYKGPIKLSTLGLDPSGSIVPGMRVTLELEFLPPAQMKLGESA